MKTPQLQTAWFREKRPPCSTAAPDVLTGGNHSFGKITMHPYLDENPRILRPANYEDRCPGRGMASFDCGRARVTVINLQGQSFMDPLRNPFYMLDTLVEQAGGGIVLVDFHAEATSEKRAFGFMRTAEVTAVLRHAHTCPDGRRTDPARRHPGILPTRA